MKKKMLQLFLFVSASLLLVVAASSRAQAQETSEGPTRRTLIGEIRWAKTIGLPPRFDGKKPLDNICEPFYVLVVDPEQDDKVFWFANLLQKGRDNPDFYRCKYEIINVPTNKRLKVIVGMGDPEKPFGNYRPHWYRDDWVDEDGKKTGDQANPLPIPGGFTMQLVFAPREKFVTLTNKDMWLPFELTFGLVRLSSIFK
jgi:hypothetical protein